MVVARWAPVSVNSRRTPPIIVARRECRYAETRMRYWTLTLLLAGLALVAWERQSAAQTPQPSAQQPRSRGLPGGSITKITGDLYHFGNKQPGDRSCGYQPDRATA